jgi:hypothetical protein
MVNAVLLLWNLRTNIWPNWLKGLLALYICASAWQLSLLVQQPQIYLRSRMRINIANR